MLSVDRIEGEYAVCEKGNGRFVKIPLIQLPDTVCEGDVLEYIDRRYVVNHKETQKRRSDNAALLKKLLKNEKD